MSITIRKSTYEDRYEHNAKCVECGCSSPDAIIESENVKIPICEECITTFIHECFGVLKDIGNTCQYCKFYKHDEYDWKRYGGSCHVKGRGRNSLDYDHEACEMFSRRDDKNE